MQYLSPILSVDIDPRPLVAVSRVARPGRGAPTESLDNFIDKVEIRLVAPTALQVAPAATTEYLCIIRLGFRMKMPEEIQIQWLRFSVKIVHNAGVGLPNRPGRILSFLPQRVTEDLAYDGRIAIDDDGMIRRDPASVEMAGNGLFNRFALGYPISPDQLVWDFIPTTGNPIAGSDNLLLTARIPADEETFFTETIHLSIAHPRYGQGSFEYPTTNKFLRKNGIS